MKSVWVLAASRYLHYFINFPTMCQYRINQSINQSINGFLPSTLCPSRRSTMPRTIHVYLFPTFHHYNIIFTNGKGETRGITRMKSGIAYKQWRIKTHMKRRPKSKAWAILGRFVLIAAITICDPFQLYFKIDEWGHEWIALIQVLFH